MKTITSSLLTLAFSALASATDGPGKGHDGPGGHHGGECKRPLVTSEKLQSRIKTEDLLAGSQKLQDFANANGGNRAFGGGGHNATVDYLYESLTALKYYDVVKQPFTEIYSEGTATFTVDGQAFDVNVMTYTPGGEATKPLVAVANLGCDVADYPATISGNIALISRGSCTFAQKSLNAKAAGAVGAVVYNNVAGELSGTLGEPFLEYAPVVGLSQEDGTALLEKLAAGEVTATLDVDAVVEERVSYNVIAETKEGDHNNVLVVGGHSDSVPAGPGINDDGSGIIGILTVAKALAKFRVNNAVRFAFWSAEEFGLLGSYYYMNSINSSETELAKIRAYLNFDMIASPNYIYGIYDGDGNAFNLTGPAGSDVLERDFEAFFQGKSTPSIPTPFSGRSDYAAFIENGIPSGGLFTGAEELKTAEEAALFGGEVGVAYDVNYHKKGDTIDNLALDAYLLNTQAIADSVAKYARSFESLPAVEAKTRRWDADRARMLKRSGGVHGHAQKHAHAGPCGGGPTI
ncbi:Zn-dependent exopeptidase [Parathielavia appendiculata]|uniref:Peptide hydrolase n=1 Tax=Parathielavia appendiculata TaxID=2587402 RepID=A0AAN6TWP5_9PEZI|nr:Zn-dependent exopeptidase [Parathielavia appendiculata]